nr:GTP-binding protein [Solihabitans fulvus]
MLAAYLDNGPPVPFRRLRAELAAQTGRALVHPVYFGSASTGAGVASLIAGVTEFLSTSDGAADGPVSGTIFKVERGAAGEKIAYVRMFSGTLRTRDRLRFRRDDGADRDDRAAADHGREGKVTAIRVFERGSTVRGPSVAAGRIGLLWGLDDARIGDAVGTPRTTPTRHQFAPPTLETVVVPGGGGDRGALHLALAQLAEQDPLINLRQDDSRRELSVSLYGEVQKEVIQATLADDFGIDVTFRESTTICVERPAGTGAAVETMHRDANPFLATVGLRVEPAPTDSGARFRLAVELGSMPAAFFKAVEDTVKETLRQGIHGWQVLDCVVTMTHAGYAARQSHSHGVFDKSMSSTAGDFRNLTPLVLLSALKRAGSTVFEPIHRFRLELPADTLGHVSPVLARLGAVPGTPVPRGASCVLDGDLPAAAVHGLQRQLPALTRGEGVLDCAFDRYRPVRGAIPTRPRSDHDPLDRDEYLLRVLRRTSTTRRADA